MRVTSVVIVAVLASCTTSRPSTATVTPRMTRPAPAAAEPEPQSAPAPIETTAPEPSDNAPADPTGVAPPVPDPALATLPVDVRVADRTALFSTHRRDCKAFAPRTACELKVDFDGDGALERAFKVRAHDGGHAGIAVVWQDGRISIIGAGAGTRQLATDVHEDGVDLSWTEVEPDLDLETWRVAEPRDGGFVVHAPRSKSVLRAPGLTGAGLWLDGGDAVEILYWDGERWRRLIVGF